MDGSGGGADPPLPCGDLLLRIRQAHGVCAFDALETFSAFKDPSWESVDAGGHGELIAKLLTYGQNGVRKYFEGTRREDQEFFRRKARDFIADGGQVEVLRIRLFERYAAGTRLARPGTQTVVRLTYKVGWMDANNVCPGQSTHGQLRRTFVVLPDLSGPDPEVDQGTAAQLEHTWPVLFMGTPVLINSTFIARGPVTCVFRREDVQRQ